MQNETLHRFMVLSLVAAGLLACSTASDNESENESSTSAEDTFTVLSSAFSEGESLPATHSCSRDGGSDLSPPLSWSNPPEGTTEYALIMYHYPDDSVETPSHYWEVWNIPSSVTSLESGNPLSVGNEGSNKDGVGTGYTPPCSPGDAVHHYTIRVYALSESLEALGSSDNLDVGWTEFIAAVEAISLGYAEVSFTK